MTGMAKNLYSYVLLIAKQQNKSYHDGDYNKHLSHKPEIKQDNPDDKKYKVI